MTPREPQEGELYRFNGGAGWCRHGLVYIVNVGRAEQSDLIGVDTYWGLAPNFGALERNFYGLASIKDKIEFVLDLKTAREVYEDEWEVYADEDRAWLPPGGGREHYFVRKAAQPVYARQVARYQRLIAEERSKAECALSTANRYAQQLQDLQAARVHSPAKHGACRPDCATCAAALAPKEPSNG